VNLLYIGFLVPFFIAFTSSIEKDVFLILESGSLLAQLLVIFVNLRTPVLFEGVHTIEFTYIMKNYWSQNALIYDVMGALPINLIFGLYPMTDMAAFISVLRLSRIIAIL
jgi:hypothetical protein